MNGGYDEGYRRCGCFWGTTPGSYLNALVRDLGSFRGLRILDAGCGEGKNAVFLARRGAIVDAVDVSTIAIENGMRTWGRQGNVRWMVADVRDMALECDYDVVVAYGLLHCLADSSEVATVVSRLQEATAVGGFNVLCAFNDRRQELAEAHPGFVPCLLRHPDYVEFYASWKVLAASDEDLTEEHPHNNIEHTHSMTRLLARKHT